MYISSFSPKYNILDEEKYTYITKYSRLHLKKKKVIDRRNTLRKYATLTLSRFYPAWT